MDNTKLLKKTSSWNRTTDFICCNRCNLGNNDWFGDSYYFGVIEVIITWLKHKKPDKFILFDIGLLSLLGAISLLLENELFFKFKPGVIGVILCTFLGIVSFSNKNIIATIEAGI
jgi:hypothetical protein